jgi:hypothetical protein
MVADSRQLIEELQYNSNLSGKPFERRLADTAIWFSENKDRIPRDNLAGRQAFLERMVWILLEMNAMALERIHKLEGGSSSLWLPGGVAVSGDVRRFG